MNRLQLNFALSTKQERVDFTRNYLATIRFQPTEDELDTIAKYILWGKDPETGLNGRQEGLELETRHGTWDGQRTESLDALIESPNFSEAMLRGPSNPPTKMPVKTPLRIFSPPSKPSGPKSTKPNSPSTFTIWRTENAKPHPATLYSNGFLKPASRPPATPPPPFSHMPISNLNIDWLS